MRRDIDDALRDWAFEPESGGIDVREIRARNGRVVLQIRIELGLLQLEVEGRPDGARPHGFDTYLHYLRHRAREYRKRPNRSEKSLATDAESIDDRWTMSPEHCIHADREFVQFHHRRIAWLSLQRYQKALADAEHTLNLMDFIVKHGISREYIESHERLRPLALFHRAQALIAQSLERHKPEEAIEIVHDTVEQVRKLMPAGGLDSLPGARPDFESLVNLEFNPNFEQDDDDDDDDNDLAERFASINLANQAIILGHLGRLEQEIRKHFEVAKTLQEQLDEAVAREDYESAAWLRDQIRSKSKTGRDRE